MKTLDHLLQSSPDPSQPLVTYYDMSTGERVELSATTMANWVAKTSNFLVDDLDAGPGTRVRIGLPSHWLRTVWMLSAWTVGAAIVDHEGDIGLSGPELTADEPTRVAASLRPLGGRFATPPEGFWDIGAEVPGHPDHFIAADPPEPTTLAIDIDGIRRTHDELLAHTSSSSERLVIAPGSIGRDVDHLIAACLGAGSLVLVAAATPDEMSRIAEQERGEVVR